MDKPTEQTGFLEEKPGVKSSERLKSIATLAFTFAFIWVYVIYKDNEMTTEFNFLVALLLTAAFAPTGLRKIQEIRSGFVSPKNQTTTKTENQ